MPIFEYECTKCESVREIIVATADEKVKWSTCKKRMTKLFPSKISFKLKGTGLV